jgi:hypothetical protein
MLRRRAHSGQEFLNLVENCIGVAHIWQMVDTS